MLKLYISIFYIHACRLGLVIAALTCSKHANGTIKRVEFTIYMSLYYTPPAPRIPNPGSLIELLFPFYNTTSKLKFREDSTCTKTVNNLLM